MSLSFRSPINILSLTAPLASEEGVGSYLRYDPVYDKIRQARHEDDDHLSQGIWKTELKKADWPLVEKTCLEALATQSKDLQIAAWLTESWIALDQFLGLERGFGLLAALCESYWGVLHPQLQENDSESIEQRITLLEWMDNLFSDKILFISLSFSKADHELTSLTLADWRSAINLDTIAKRTNEGKTLLSEAENEGKPTLNHFRKRLDLLPQSDLKDRLKEISLGQTSLDHFRTILTTALGTQAPTFSKVKQNLDDLSRILTHNLQGRPHEGAEPLNSTPQVLSPFLEENSSFLENHNPLPESSSESEEKVIANREDAYNALKEISGFLKTLDAHSPIPDLLDLIVSWKNKTLVEIISDIGAGNKEGHILLRLFATSLQSSSIKL